MIKIPIRAAEKLKPMPAATEFKFGQHFSDHWFYSKYSEGKGWFESQVEPYRPILMDPAASVLHYGQALFEGMKAFRQKDGSIALFRPDFNFRRLCEGAARLCLEAPPEDVFMKGLEELIRLDARWVPKEENCSLYVRPTLIGTEAFLGVRPSRDVLFYILLSPAGSYFSSGSSPVRIWVEDQALRAAPGGLGATKAGANYAASLQAALTAKKNGYDQVLWLDVERQGIEEVGTMNVFFVFNDEIVTPALNGSILAGGVRDSVIQFLTHEKAPINVRRITMDEIVTRHQKGQLLEMFGTGTAAVITPVGEIHYKGKSIVFNNGKVGPVAHRLFNAISGIQRGLVEDTFGWMKKID